MSEIYKGNIDILKSYKDNFSNEKENFKSTSKSTFSNSYLSSCSDPIIQTMYHKLNTKYEQIEKKYQAIDTWWSNYLSDMENLENILSNRTGSGSIKEPALSSYLSSMIVELSEYHPAFIHFKPKELSGDFTIKKASQMSTDNHKLRKETTTTASASFNTNAMMANCITTITNLLMKNNGKKIGPVETKASTSGKAYSVLRNIKNIAKTKTITVSSTQNITESQSLEKNKQDDMNLYTELQTLDNLVITIADYDYAYQYLNSQIQNELDLYQETLKQISSDIKENNQIYVLTHQQYIRLKEQIWEEYYNSIQKSYLDPTNSNQYLDKLGIDSKSLINIDKLEEKLWSLNVSDEKTEEIINSFRNLKSLDTMLRDNDFNDTQIQEIIEYAKLTNTEIYEKYQASDIQFDEINQLIQKETNGEFTNTTKFFEYYEGLLRDQAMFQSVSYIAEQNQKSLKYTTYTMTKEYSDFNNEVNINETNLAKSKNLFGVYDYDVYIKSCSESEKISPLQYMKKVLEKNPNAKIEIDNCDVSQLKLMLELSEARPATEGEMDLEKLYNFTFYYGKEEDYHNFLNAMEDEINKYHGEKKAQEYLNQLREENGKVTWDDVYNHILTTDKGLKDGIETFGYGMYYAIIDAGYVIGPLKKDGSRVYNADEYETMYIMQALMSHEDKINAGLITVDENGNEVSNSYLIDYTKEYTKGLTLNYEVSQGIGNMLPSMAVSAIPVVGQPLGAITMGVSAAGNSYHSAMVEGYDSGQAKLYGLMSGLSEAGLEYLLGGIPGLSKGDAAVTSISKLLARGFDEGKEEFLQEYIDALFRKAIMGEDIDIGEVTDAALHSGFVGGITGGIMNIPSLATNLANIHSSKYLMNYNNISKVEVLEALGKYEIDYTEAQINNTFNALLEENPGEMYKVITDISNTNNVTKENSINQQEDMNNNDNKYKSFFTNTLSNIEQAKQKIHNMIMQDSLTDAEMLKLFKIDEASVVNSNNNVSTNQVNTVSKRNELLLKIKNIKYPVGQTLKTVSGLSMATIGGTLVPMGPLGTVIGVPLLYKGLKTAQDGVLGNTIQDSFLITAKRTIKTEDGVVKINRLYQNSLALNDFFKSRLEVDKQKYFLLRSLNAFQQFKPNQKYATLSQANTYMLLKRAQELGYIRNLNKVRSTYATKLASERFLLGVKQKESNIQMYELTFETTDAKIDKTAVEKILEKAKIDTSNYVQRTGPKGTVIFDYDVNKAIKEKVTSINTKLKEKKNSVSVTQELESVNKEIVQQVNESIIKNEQNLNTERLNILQEKGIPIENIQTGQDTYDNANNKPIEKIFTNSLKNTLKLSEEKAKLLGNKIIEFITGNYDIGFNESSFENINETAQMVSDIMNNVDSNDFSTILRNNQETELAQVVTDGIMIANPEVSYQATGKFLNNNSKRFQHFFVQSLQNIRNANQKFVNLIAHLSKMNTLESENLNHNIIGKFIGGLGYDLLSGTLMNKRKYTNVTNSQSMLNTIQTEGILHFSSPDTVIKIINSQTVKKSSFLISDMTSPKSFFFGGVPSFEDLLINIPAYDVMTAVKIRPTEEQIKSLKYRPLNDRAVVFDGDFKFDTNQAEIVYFGLDLNENNQIYLKSLTKEEAEHYQVSDKLRELYNYQRGKNNLYDYMRMNVYGFCAEYRHHQRLMEFERNWKSNLLNYNQITDAELLDLFNIDKERIHLNGENKDNK